MTKATTHLSNVNPSDDVELYGELPITAVAGLQLELDDKADKVTIISTTLPLTGGGDLSANRSLAINPATTSDAGSMSSGDKSKLDEVVSGTYTPTITNQANITSSTQQGDIHYIRVGNIVSMGGTTSITPTATGAACILRISLPIASAIAATTDASGSGAAIYSGVVPYEIAAIRADVATDTIVILLSPNTTNAYTVRWLATYQII